MRRTKPIRPTGELSEPPHSGPIVPVLAFAGIAVAAMQTPLVPVIKDLPVLLSTDPANATWVMTATLLAGTPGEQLGRRALPRPGPRTGRRDGPRRGRRPERTARWVAVDRLLSPASGGTP